MGLVPVHLGIANRAVRQAQPRKTLELPPASGTISAPQASYLPNCIAYGNRLNFRDQTDDFEFHRIPLYFTPAATDSDTHKPAAGSPLHHSPPARSSHPTPSTSRAVARSLPAASPTWSDDQSRPDNSSSFGS